MPPPDLGLRDTGLGHLMNGLEVGEVCSLGFTHSLQRSETVYMAQVAILFYSVLHENSQHSNESALHRTAMNKEHSMDSELVSRSCC
jgi:hypothetical protein